MVTQGESLDETLRNLREAVALYMENEVLAAHGLVPNPRLALHGVSLVTHAGGGQIAAGLPMSISNWPKEVVNLRKDRDLWQASERENKALNAAWCLMAL